MFRKILKAFMSFMGITYFSFFPSSGLNYPGNYVISLLCLPVETGSRDGGKSKRL